MLPRAAALALAVAAGCAAPGHPPTARVAIAPAYLPLGDGYATDVQLDGSASTDPIDDPTGAVPLSYFWEVDDPAVRVTAGALDRATVTVRVAAAHPTIVTLTVTDRDGDAGST